ncbi:MAG: hypothetical protein NW220_08810 [Leptolyngbyaceae cyanobacterium bins.349]|nr:hypothetical protein [Leptolyngbyaceae cyanobacterium bins.349]
MSEVVNPAMNPASDHFDDSAQSAPTPMTVDAADSQGADEEWQTVSFPGALNVDTIPSPVASVPPAPTLVDVVPITPFGDAEGQEMNRLHQENASLRTQVAQLEDDLSQAQIELQLEVARFFCKEAEAAELQERDRLTLTLEEAEAQVQQLTQSLQTSQESIERQQAEIQSLRQQIEQGQQRIAQLERECALSQQRYNEQLQLVSQAENACQDLRMRLHRQQQQTLQFKAALEKSIEMTAAIDPMQSEQAAIASGGLIHPGKDETPFLPKTQPVQPWSHEPDAVPHLHPPAKQRISGLPHLLAKLAKQPLTTPKPKASTGATPDPVVPLHPAIAVPSPAPAATTGSEIIEVAAVTPSAAAQPDPVVELPQLDEASKNILEFLFPAQSSAAIANPAPSPNPIFDLGPFIEAGEVAAEHLSTVSEVTPTAPIPSQEVEPAPAIPTTNRSGGDGLWADLARLIEPDLTVDAAIAPPEPSPSQPLEAIAPQAANLNQTVESISTPAAKLQPAAKSLSLVSFSLTASSPTETPPLEEGRVVPQNPFPSFTLHNPSELPLENVVTPSVELSQTAVSINSPSPILYPARPAKKLTSMAAVDLPSFPRG